MASRRVIDPPAARFRQACRRLRPDEQVRGAALLLGAYATLVVVCGAILSSLTSLIVA